MNLGTHTARFKKTTTKAYTNDKSIRLAMCATLLTIFINISLTSCSQPDTIQPQETAYGQTREASSILNADNFEKGSLAKFWGQILFKATDLNLSGEQARAGSKSAKFSWKPSQYDGSNMSCHSEVAADLLNEQESERWYGFSMYLPSSTMANDDQLVNIMQWHDLPDAGYEGTVPPIALELHPDNSLNLYCRASNKPITKFMQHPTSQKKISLGLTPFDRWVDFVVHVKWDATGKTGVLQIWQDGVLKVDEQNISLGYPKTRPYWKFGLYCWTGKASHAERTMYYDDIRIGGPNADYDVVKPGRSNGSAREIR